MEMVVLVHGFWHGSWCWSLVAEELAGLGIASVAVDLQGHGLRGGSPDARWQRPYDAERFAAEVSPLAGVTVSSAAALLVEQVGRVARGRKCLLVAHSLGGVIATAVAEAAPELVGGVLYVSGFAPVRGEPAGAYFGAPENADSLVAAQLVADPSVGALRLDPGDRSRHAGLRTVFYNDLDETTAAAAISLLGSDGPVGFVTEGLVVTPGRYGAIQHGYVLCRRDNTVPPALQRRFIAEIDAMSARPTTVFELDSGHSPFLSRPGALAEMVRQFGRRPAAMPESRIRSAF